jgi:hypothetical protein
MHQLQDAILQIQDAGYSPHRRMSEELGHKHNKCSTVGKRYQSRASQLAQEPYGIAEKNTAISSVVSSLPELIAQAVVGGFTMAKDEELKNQD